ncbi:MAG: hypothetical protein R3A13_05160 [Bdellovibrionota bacterium]
MKHYIGMTLVLVTTVPVMTKEGKLKMSTAVCIRIQSEAVGKIS